MCIIQHVAFYQKLKAERDKTYAEKDKAKTAYHDACVEIQNVRNKIAKGTGDHDKVLYYYHYHIKIKRGTKYI